VKGESPFLGGNLGGKASLPRKREGQARPRLRENCTIGGPGREKATETSILNRPGREASNILRGGGPRRGGKSWP